ncbi:hypothetical protein BDZ91DRAFT_256672 [Kalaharituber pfeilii]|nr:hypothetical protein BDZ91DRAFT_256672 [Kalaharituber pfeilii]
MLSRNLRGSSGRVHVRVGTNSRTPTGRGSMKRHCQCDLQAGFCMLSDGGSSAHGRFPRNFEIGGILRSSQKSTTYCDTICRISLAIAWQPNSSRYSVFVFGTSGGFIIANTRCVAKARIVSISSIGTSSSPRYDNVASTKRILYWSCDLELFRQKLYSEYQSCSMRLLCQ